MQNFYTRLFVRMREYLLVPTIVIITFVSFVAIWRLYQGYYPGSKWIVEDPPLGNNGLDSNQARFMFFYTNWCPWSHKARPHWNSFKQSLRNRPMTYGGKEVVFEEINAEADVGKATLYHVSAYPTFKLETSDKVYVLIGPPDLLTFDYFLETALGKKAPHK